MGVKIVVGFSRIYSDMGAGEDDRSGVEKFLPQGPKREGSRGHGVTMCILLRFCDFRRGHMGMEVASRGNK